MPEGFNSVLKMKRKDLDQVNEEFSDFSLTSPARKIRRLDAELAPITEEEPEIPLVFERPENEGSFGGGNGRVGGGGVVIEELPNGVENEERAIVVFNPVNSPLLQSPSNYSISVSPPLISGLKNQLPWSNYSSQWRALESEDRTDDNKSGRQNECLAVVPWVPPPHLYSTSGDEAVPQIDVSDMMEADDAEVSTMDVEDNTVGSEQKVGMNVNEGLRQWQQQHCMIPQPPQNISTPIVWFQ
ncbi:unnamed protein product [Coffea canephora]|uniref:DH200=94 genomic scaffold, scaffold_978 n=2 Tax=Coffea TaxID=13442 RepID=A0A068VHN3_COFCA|nr:uncharacterized protein LOC113691641 [Coffea arabica]CDP20191.1 unnamed protein product [Coffea canephora]